MKFSERWLREWVDPPASTEQLAERLTMSGLEVESVAAVAAPFSGVCVTEISGLRAHPDAAHLRICSATVGGGETLQIVTGAANVRDGMRVPLACVGAVLPGNKLIARSKLRGVESEGMLCSTVELGMADTAEGVLELPADAPLGMDVREYLGLDDATIELNITPNRGDCLGMLGIAREVAAEFGVAARKFPSVPVSALVEDQLPVHVEAPADCPRYVGRIIRGINSKARAPIWLVERLRRSGVRSIHPVVDVTNYVMLELGQPMHAFDLRRLRGAIRVRRAGVGETLTVLDGQTMMLSRETLVIADDRHAIAMAGIMGGAESAVTVDTVDVFLESAYFTAATTAARARAYKLQTDSSYRFERGVDVNLQVAAIERATQLVMDICGGQPGPVTEAASPNHLPVRRDLTLRRARLQRVLGYLPPETDIGNALRRLGMDVKVTVEGWNVRPPSYRQDIALEADLMEEVVRITGYDGIPQTMPGGVISLAWVPEGGTAPLARAREVLVQRGYQEAITYSFIDAQTNGRIRPDCVPIVLANPISMDMAVMRASLWGGLCRALAHNLSRQQQRVRLFEIGAGFKKDNGTLIQINKISGLLCGTSWPEQWSSKARAADLFDVVGDVQALLAVLAPRSDIQARRVDDPALHPGQAAGFVQQDRLVATCGALHPELLRYFDLDVPIFAFEVDLDFLRPGGGPRYRPLSKFPSVRRDLSLTVDRALPVADLMECVRASAPETLRHLQLFDVYEGEGIDSGKKSVALGLIFQGTSSTLIDKDIDVVIATVVSRLARQFGAKLRDF